MSGADLHHADLRRPEGMDQKIYDNLCKEYKRVSQNLHVAEGRANTSARTLARNQQLKETERETLKRHLDNFKNNPTIQAALQQIGGDTTEALKILRNMETRQTQIEAHLRALTSSSSSSSSPPAAAEVEMVEASDVEKIECNVCFDSYPDCLKMPCCKFWACRECLFTLLTAHDIDVECPYSRHRLSQVEGFGEVTRQLTPCLPQDIMRVLQGGGCVMPLVNLFGSSFRETGASYQMFHSKIHVEESKIDVNPAWVNLELAPGMVKKMPMQMLSVPNDEIHKFVKEKCNNVWPKRGSYVRILTAFPAMYDFKRFEKPINDKACCLLELPSDEGEQVKIPLSEIRSLQAERSHEDEVDAMQYFEPGKKLLLKHYLRPWRFYFYKSTDFNTYGPVLNLQEHGGDPVAFASATVENIIFKHFEDVFLESDWISVENGAAIGHRLPVPCVVRVTWMKPDGYGESEFQGDVTFWGYSSEIDIVIQHVHFTKGSKHRMFHVRDVRRVRYICTGSV